VVFELRERTDRQADILITLLCAHFGDKINVAYQDQVHGLCLGFACCEAAFESTFLSHFKTCFYFHFLTDMSKRR